MADLESAAKEFGDGRMLCVAGDLANPADIQRLFDETMERCGRVDILVNNAALYPKQTFLESSIDEWARVIDVNVTGVARCCHHALPIMLKRGYGRIINVGTFAWKAPIPASSAYSASKGAIPALTKALASEIDRVKFPDVLVNEFVPGVYRTAHERRWRGSGRLPTRTRSSWRPCPPTVRPARRSCGASSTSSIPRDCARRSSDWHPS